MSLDSLTYDLLICAMLGSIILQLTAATLAIRQYLTRHNHNIEWFLFSIALTIMAIRRIAIGLTDYTENHIINRPGVYIENSLGIIISALLLTTVILTMRRLSKLSNQGAKISRALDSKISEYKNGH